MITLNTCKELDQKDELGFLRTEFDLPENVIYMDGNSLGAKPLASLEKAQDVINHEWGVDLINSWNKADWWNLPLRLGNQLAPLIGAKDYEVAVTDTTSQNLFKVLATALHMQKDKEPQRNVIIAEKDAFPTDLYMIDGLIKLMGGGYTLKLIDTPEDLEQLANNKTAAAILSHVNYRTGYLYDMSAVNAKLHAKGVLAIWDLCHSVGAVTIDLTKDDADFAIGCTYKYLNGGPGSPAFVWVPSKFQNTYTQPLSGWWGHAKPFDMATEYAPADGIRRYLSSTQPIVSMSLVECGLATFEKTNMQAIRQKSLALTDLFLELIDQECTNQPLECITPKDHHYRGSHISLRHPNGYAVVQALIERDIIIDYREPEVMRFGVTPLYLRYQDIWNAVQQLKDILINETWNQPKYIERKAVT